MKRFHMQLECLGGITWTRATIIYRDKKRSGVCRTLLAILVFH